MAEHIYSEFLLTALLSVVLVLASFMVFYEGLRVVWVLRDKLSRRPRLLIHLMVLAVFAAHTTCVWMYGIVYWLLAEKFGLGGFHGYLDGHWMHYVYYSATTYSSLGFGDINPSGAMRLLSGVEVLNGLILIGWSVTYTYFATEKYLNHIKREEERKDR